MAPWKIDKWKEAGFGGRVLATCLEAAGARWMENTLSFKALGTAHPGDTFWLPGLWKNKFVLVLAISFLLTGYSNNTSLIQNKITLLLASHGSQKLGWHVNWTAQVPSLMDSIGGADIGQKRRTLLSQHLQELYYVLVSLLALEEPCTLLYGLGSWLAAWSLLERLNPAGKHWSWHLNVTSLP